MLASVEISRRLKAARWLVGGEDARGKPTALSVEDLAAREPLPANRITSNRLEEIEQLKADARPMELDKIAEALGLPPWWFTAAASLGALNEVAAGSPTVPRALRALADQLERPASTPPGLEDSDAVTRQVAAEMIADDPVADAVNRIIRGDGERDDDRGSESA